MRESTQQSSMSSWTELFLIVGICWGWFVVRSVAISLGFMDQQIFNDEKFIALLGYELLAGLLAFYILKIRGWEIKVDALKANWVTTGAGLLILLLSTPLYWVTYEVGVGIGGSTEPLRDLASSTSVSWPIAISTSIVNGVYEEVLLIGFIFKVLQRYDMQFIVGVSVLLRVIAHVYQGPVGALGVLTMGILFAMVYARYRQLWPLIVAHAGIDILAFVR